MTTMTESAASIETQPRRRRLWLAAGYALFAVGLAGTVLPVLPTTVFWIGAAGCFAKSCPAMHRRIMTWPRIGPVIDDFLTHGVIGTRSKIVAITGMSVGALLVLFAEPPALVTAIAFAIIGLAALYVVTRPGLKPVDTVT